MPFQVECRGSIVGPFGISWFSQRNPAVCGFRVRGVTGYSTGHASWMTEASLFGSSFRDGELWADTLNPKPQTLNLYGLGRFWVGVLGLGFRV